MRTRAFTVAGLLGMALGIGFGFGLGCSDLTTGTVADDPGPPKLSRLMIQDELPAGDLGNATDLLDTGPLATCSDNLPCVSQPTIDGNLYPDCTMGVCPDPLHFDASTKIAIGALEGGELYGGNQIRFVFNKLLDPAIQTLSMDAMGRPVYGLVDGLVELDLKSTGARVDTYNYWDSSGALVTSDVINQPYGPAIVMKPRAQLSPNTTYTIKLTSSMIKDHNGIGPAADARGNPLPSPFTIDFTTEDLRVLGSTPNVVTLSMGMPRNIRPDDVIQFHFNAGVKEPPSMARVLNSLTASVVLVNNASPMTPVRIEVWSDRGGGGTSAPNPARCVQNLDDTLLDVVAVSAAGMPADLTIGATYTLTFNMIRDNRLGTGTPFTKSYMFTVMGPKDPTDRQRAANFVLPENCNPAQP